MLVLSECMFKDVVEVRHDVLVVLGCLQLCLVFEVDTRAVTGVGARSACREVGAGLAVQGIEAVAKTRAVVGSGRAGCLGVDLGGSLIAGP